jgi:precorrin-2 dehydrogenase/sirohydrochlorin ferrochelatase
MRYYPVFLNLRGRPCVVVGGGKVAERKVRAMLRAGASVRVISPGLTPALVLLRAKKKIQVTPRRYRKGDLLESGPGSGRPLPLLVFAATNHPATQRTVREDAETLGILLNAADDREHSTFLVPASFAQGDLQVAISTSGASPALARNLRRKLQATLGSEYAAYLRFLRAGRKQVLRLVPSQKRRAQVFRQLAGRLGAEWFQAGKPRATENEVRKLLRKLGVKTRR